MGVQRKARRTKQAGSWILGIALCAAGVAHSRIGILADLDFELFCALLECQALEFGLQHGDDYELAGEAVVGAG